MRDLLCFACSLCRKEARGCWIPPTKFTDTVVTKINFLYSKFLCCFVQLRIKNNIKFFFERYILIRAVGFKVQNSNSIRFHLFPPIYHTCSISCFVATRNVEVCPSCLDFSFHIKGLQYTSQSFYGESYNLVFYGVKKPKNSQLFKSFGKHKSKI